MLRQPPGAMQAGGGLHRAAFLCCLLASAAAPAAEPPEPATLEIRLRTADGAQRDRFDVLGLTALQLDQLRQAEDLSRMFSVHVWSDGRPSATPLLGSWELAADRLTFEPRFGLLPGVTYWARFRAEQLPAADGQKPIEGRFPIPPLPPRAAGQVVQVFPSSDLLPENTLKFYIHFSVPMRRGEAYRQVRLFQASGERVEYPFLELGEELWDPSGKRFTLFFDPGRIKRGLKPREEVGPALEEGESYTLVIDQTWPDDRGQELARPYRKQFSVVSPDYTQPDTETWEWQLPRGGTREWLAITMPEPLDHAMLMRVLVVLDDADRVVEGTTRVSQNEMRWEFQPQRPWRRASYHLSVDTALEDRAGNSLASPFEVDLFRTVEKTVSPKLVRLPFEIE